MALEYPVYRAGHEYYRLPTRYRMVSLDKWAADGSVGRAFTSGPVTPTEVAIKKTPLPQGEPTEMRKLLREVLLLQRLSHPNVTSLLDIFTAPTVQPSGHHTDVYLVTQELPSDLELVLREHAGLPIAYVQYFGYQLLDAISYLHAQGVVHKGITPSNLLVSDNNFRVASPSDEAPLPYRAPELLLETKAYSPAIDVWSIGCVLYEMAAGYPLFTGKDIRNQLEKILTVVRKPGAEALKKITSVRAREFMEQQPEREVRALEDMVRGERERKGKSCEYLEEFCDLLDKMIVFDPERRITAAEALGHAFWKCGEEPAPEGGEAAEAEPADAPNPDRIDPQIETKGVEELEALLNYVIDCFKAKRDTDQQTAVLAPSKM